MAKLVVKITHGLDDPERAHIGWNVAAVALSGGVDVHVFLAVEGVRLAQPGIPEQLQLADAPPVADLIATVYSAGAVTVCTPCATRRGLSAADFRDGTQLAGSAAFVALAVEDGSTALVY